MRNLIFRVHAIQKMFERNITRNETASVIAGGEVIREYLDDKPFPSRLMLGWNGDRPLHVVAADTPDDETIIITVYEPDPAIWESDFRTKKEQN